MNYEKELLEVADELYTAATKAHNSGDWEHRDTCMIEYERIMGMARLWGSAQQSLCHG